MAFVRMTIGCTLVLLMSATTLSPARADAYGCSYDKCVAYCTKVSGKFCTTHCEKRLKEKRNQNICK